MVTRSYTTSVITGEIHEVAQLSGDKSNDGLQHAGLQKLSQLRLLSEKGPVKV